LDEIEECIETRLTQMYEVDMLLFSGVEMPRTNLPPTTSP